MKYLLGGYYLLKLQPLTYGLRKSRIVFTASDCINDNLINSWAYSWTTGTRKETKIAKDALHLNDEDVNCIREWVDSKNAENLLGWINVFANKEIAREYWRRFFSHVENVHLFALYLDEESVDDIRDEFRPATKEHGEIGLYQFVSKRTPESHEPDEQIIGYDLIGIEGDGDFHSFHCHDIGDELSDKFGLVLNESGLFNEINDWKPVLDYLNDEENGCEPVPWFVTKVKLVSN